MNYNDPNELVPPDVPFGPIEAHVEMPEVGWWCEDRDLDAIQMFKAHTADAGFDICASQDTFLDSNKEIQVHTGLHVKIPFGYVGLIRPRSGLSMKSGYSIGAGVIDAGYRGEVIVQLRMRSLALSIKKGDRIAQLVVVPCLLGAKKADSLEDLGKGDRGDAGFGSTGA